MLYNSFSHQIKSFVQENKLLCTLTFGLAIVGYTIGNLGGRAVAWLSCLCGTTKKVDSTSKTTLSAIKGGSGLPSLSLPIKLTKTSSAAQLWDILNENSSAIKIAYLEESEVNHRFEDIKCPRDTAIAVEGGFLHANTIVNRESKIHFVASQAPLKKEETMFWKSIFENHYAIMDLTTLSDQNHGVTKYYPEHLNESIMYGNLSVKLNEKRDFFCEYQITDTITGVIKKVIRYHFTEWKDFGAVSVSDLKRLIQVLETEMGNRVWVHCRAGVGRTGTFITAFLLKNKISNGAVTQENLDATLLHLIVEMRKRRGHHFVQKPVQLDLLRQFGKSLLH